MTQAYIKYTANTADSLLTDVISINRITVDKVIYYGNRQANVPCNFVIEQHYEGAWKDGRVYFGFQLSQSSPGSSWKIASGGTG